MIMSSKVVTFVHLDLGIGGAERLVVNLATALTEDEKDEKGNQRSAYDVKIITSHHDPNHCFDETKPDGILGQCISVHGDWLPRSIFGKAAALCAIVRMLYISLMVIVSHYLAVMGLISSTQRSDVIVLDGVSAPIPLFYLAGIPVVFYCHFPDKLLCTDRNGRLKQLYRGVIDTIEEFTTGCATIIVVNSKFTATAFHASFPWISPYFQPKVLYPTIEEDNNTNTTTKITLTTSTVTTSNTTSSTTNTAMENQLAYTQGYDYIFVSLNRYERKKNIELALNAFSCMKNSLDTMTDINSAYFDFLHVEKKKKKILLVIAGGYDTRVKENVEYLMELKQRAIDLNLSVTEGQGLVSELSPSSTASKSLPDVVFRTSISGYERSTLLSNATALLYTPDNEHFGIVPLESMYVGTPVIAVASGGPLETIVPGETGFLCPSDAKAFSEAMLSFVNPLSTTEKTKLLALLDKTNTSTSTSTLNIEPTMTSTSSNTNANNTNASTTTNSSITAITSASESNQPPLTLSTLMGRLGRAHVEANFTSRNTRHMLITCLQNAISTNRTSSFPWYAWFFSLLSLLTCFLSYLWYKRVTS